MNNHSVGQMWNPLRFKNLQISDRDLMGNKFNGHDLHIYLNQKGIQSHQMVLHRESTDQNTIEIPFLSNKIRFTLSLMRSRQLLDAQLVHLHLIHNMPFEISFLPILSSIKPVVITLHDPFFIGANCIHHGNCEKWKNYCYKCEKNDWPPYQDIHESSIAFAHKKHAIQNSQITAIVASSWMEKKVKASPIWYNKPIHRIPFGIDHEIFSPGPSQNSRESLGIPENARVLMFRQSSIPYKGQEIAIAALSEVKVASNTYLLTVGEKGLLSSLKEKFSIIEFAWIKDDHKLADLYRACDLFLMPSRQEAFGMMAIEAMSCGKPVLALDGTALPEVIDAPRCGVAVKESEYARELQRLLDHPEELRDRGSRSLDFARKEYNSEVYIDRILDVYREVMERHKLDDLARHMLEELEESSRRLERSNPSAENPGHQSVSRIGRKMLRGLKKRIPRSWKQAIKRMLDR